MSCYSSNAQKSVGPGETQPRELRELVGPMAEPLPIAYHQSRPTGQAPAACSVANVTLIHSKGRTQGTAGLPVRPQRRGLSGSTVPSPTRRRGQHGPRMRASQRGFMEGSSCLTTPISCDSDPFSRRGKSGGCRLPGFWQSL